MALFALYGWDGPQGAALRKVHRAEHLARLEALHQENRVVAAGPLTDGAGSLLILEFPDQAAAEAWMAADVYVRVGIFERTETHPFTLVFPQ
jgi:uncharacterized protein YciI